MNERTARSLLAQAITNEQSTIAQAELQTAANVLRHSPQFQTALRELAAGLEAEAISPLPDWPARLRAYIQAQLSGDGDLSEFRDVQQQLARSVELTQGYLALYDELEQQQQRRRKLVELGRLLLLGILCLGAAVSLLQQDRPEWGLPLLTLTIFGLGFVVAAQFTPRSVSQLLRQELLSSYQRMAVSSTMIALIVLGGYTFQSLIYHRPTVENMSANLGATDFFKDQSSDPVSKPITATQPVERPSSMITEEVASLLTACDMVNLLQPNQPVRQEIHPNETDLYDVAIPGPGTLKLSILTAASTIAQQQLDVRFYNACIGGSLIGELAVQEVRNQLIDLQDPQTTLSLPVRQQIFTVRIEEARDLIRIQLQSRPENPSSMLYVLSSSTE
ncbi:MAG: hypothetical protein DYG89_31225 [Caldilinea sp. CFX5]|nr:hypothetical protein [Caldilinea sp. CFX5]